MSKWQSTCTCGDTVDVEADSKEEAVNKMVEMMNPEAVAAHMAEKHPGKEVPTPEQVRSGIEETTVEVN